MLLLLCVTQSGAPFLGSDLVQSLGMNQDPTGTAALMDLWRELRESTFARTAGTSVGTSEALGVSDLLQVNFDAVRASVTRPPTGEVNLGGPPPTAVVAPPELLLGIELPCRATGTMTE